MFGLPPLHQQLQTHRASVFQLTPRVTLTTLGQLVDSPSMVVYRWNHQASSATGEHELVEMINVTL